MNRFLHQELADGKWFTMTLLEQMSNIGSEVHRTLLAVGNTEQFQAAFRRALELFYLTLSDARWRGTGRYREIGRIHELYCHAVFGNNEYQTTLADLDRYFHSYTYAAQLERYQLRQKILPRRP
ncbi:MAG TPA: hypothetical protein VLF94_02460 [Chlamydiales bacterium]|nr:hypothetical protein [Chlamydiales bacterium]